MQTNGEYIEKLYRLRDAGEWEQCADLCKRMTTNFNIESDTFLFVTHFDVIYPHRKLGRELREQGRPELIANNILDIPEVLNKRELQLYVQAYYKFGKLRYRGGVDDKDNSKKTYPSVGFRLWATEVCRIFGNRREIPSEEVNDLRELLNEWLDKPLGHIDHW